VPIGKQKQESMTNTELVNKELSDAELEAVTGGQDRPLAPVISRLQPSPFEVANWSSDSDQALHQPPLNLGVACTSAL